MSENQHQPHLEIGIEEMKKLLERHEVSRIRNDFFQKTSLLVIASLGFVTALAWDKMLKAIFEKIFHDLSSITESFIYALLVTVIAAIASIALTKMFAGKKEACEPVAKKD